MGYTTEFEGSFKIDQPVDNETAILLKGLANTRRMKRNIKGYGIDGEFYIEGEDVLYGEGKNKYLTIVDYNTPPSTQPGLWCQWELQDDNQTIMWDGAEKFYNYVEWIEYIIKSILEPRGYIVNGEVKWFGEDRHDNGKIIIKNNIVNKKEGKITYHKK